MASTASSTSTSTPSALRLALMVTVCLLLLMTCSCSAPLKTVSNRKVLVAVEDLPLAGNAGGNQGGEMVLASESELRRVPSGPDPLHHHGSGPKKPDNRNYVPQNP